MRLILKGLPIAAALLVMAAPASAADGGIWQSCIVDSVFTCAPTGCFSQKPAISLYISTYGDAASERSAYYRCALKLTACQRYRADVDRAGNVVIFTLPGRSVFAKLEDGNRITDVAAVGDWVIISRGKCASAAPPPQSALKPR